MEIISHLVSAEWKKNLSGIINIIGNETDRLKAAAYLLPTLLICQAGWRYFSAWFKK
jgi:hypothetical protein